MCKDVIFFLMKKLQILYILIILASVIEECSVMCRFIYVKSFYLSFCFMYQF